MGPPFPGRFNFIHHPWTKQIHDDDSEFIVCQKGAQLGLTETALNKTFFAIDVKGISVLYILPAGTPDAGDFSTSRFDPALELSPHLQNLFSNVKNIGHKRAGNANLFIRGSRSRSQLKSVPVSLIIADEIDEMVQKNIALALERVSGQVEKQTIFLSTPTIPKFGINFYFLQSDQCHYIFKCPYCQRLTELIFPECLVVTADNLLDSSIIHSHLICKECKHKLVHESKVEWLADGKWEPSYTDRSLRGYYINQLYSMTVSPPDIARAVLQAETNPADEQELYNSKIGITHTVKGARITDVEIENCTGDYTMNDVGIKGHIATMGIDVGKWLHYEIDEWTIDPTVKIPDVNLISKCRIRSSGKVLNFSELLNIAYRNKVAFIVIDANPERRKAREFCSQLYGHAKMCFYGTGIQGKDIHVHDESEQTITVDRTSWMDMALGRFHVNRIMIPKDTSLEYKEHLQAPVRIYKKDTSGNPVAYYVTGNEDDHFAHARTYAEIALKFAMSLAKSENIGSVL